MIKCLIIDDEELARKLIENHVEKVDFLEAVGSFDSPIKAMEVLNSQHIDLVFLDIQMPDLKGTEFAKLIQGKTQVIFTTAYSEYALEGYELDVVDYLLKPITFDRFLMAVNKVKIPQETNTEKKTDEFITVKSGYDFYKVKLNDIYFIKSDGEYVVFHTENKKIMSYQSLKVLEQTLPTSRFMRVHRSYIINKDKVIALRDRYLMVKEQQIPVSNTYFEDVKNLLF